MWCPPRTPQRSLRQLASDPQRGIGYPAAHLAAEFRVGIDEVGDTRCKTVHGVPPPASPPKFLD